MDLTSKIGLLCFPKFTLGEMHRVIFILYNSSVLLGPNLEDADNLEDAGKWKKWFEKKNKNEDIKTIELSDGKDTDSSR